MDAAARHVADDEAYTGPGERDDVEPVARDAGAAAGGQVAMGGGRGAELGRGDLEQAALEGKRGVAFAGVAAGVVHAHRRAGHDLPGHGQIVGVEGVGALPPVEVGDAEGDIPGAQRDDHHRVDSGGGHFPGTVPVVGHPVLRAFQGRQEHGRARGHGVGLGCGRMEGDQRAGQIARLRGILMDRADGCAVQYGPAADGAGDVLLTECDALQQVDGDEVGEPGDGHGGEFDSGTGDVEGGADFRTGVVEQHQPVAGPVALGDLHDGGGHAQNRVAWVHQAEGGAAPLPLPPL